MNDILRLIGEYTKVSRVYIFEDFNNSEYTKNTYEWCNRNIKPQIDNLQETPYAIIPSWKKILNENGMVFSTNISELPQDLIDILEPQKIKSILALPIYVKDQFFGVMGFDECEKHRVWDNSEIDLLKTVANIISTIFERKQAEDALRESERRFRDVTENALEWIWEVDASGKYTYASPACKKILGYKPEELPGKYFYDLFVPEEQEQLKKTAFEAFASKQLFREFINQNIHKSGKLVWISTSGVPILDKKGNLLGYRGADTDITERKQAEERLKKAMNATIDTMSKIIEAKDPYTSDHQHRVCQLAVPLAQELGLSEDKIEGIRITSLIHDIGKIGLPTEILSKPGKLTDIEFSLIKEHSQKGYDILKSIDFSYPIAQIVLQHHERLDGSGYPNNLKGDEILLEAKIVGVADVVEAMSSFRPYRPALEIDAALEEIIQNKGTLYDPEVVDVCLKLFKEKGFKFEQMKLTEINI